MYHGWRQTEYWSNIFPGSAFIKQKHPSVQGIRDETLRTTIADMLQVHPKRRPPIRECIKMFTKQTADSYSRESEVSRACPPTIAPRPSVSSREMVLASLKKLSDPKVVE